MEKEWKANARGAGAKGQYEIRKSVIRMLQDGKSGQETAKLLGVSEGHVSNVKKLYEEGGLEGLRIGQRGRKSGQKRVLTAEQETELQRTLTEKAPEDFGYPESLWTRNTIQRLIAERYGFVIKLTTLGTYLARWKFTPQRPTRRAYKQDGEKIDAWLNTEFPGICARAKAENAAIFFGDETNIQNTANYMRGYAPMGQPPVVKVESVRFKANMLSAISKAGKLRFMLYADNMNAKKLIDFLRRLIKDIPQKVFLIMDNLKVHHANKVNEWVEKHKDRIELFYLPPYAPEYNPDELLNSDVKRNAGAKTSPRSQKELESNVRSRLKKLQNNPAIVTSFFQARLVKYAS